MPSLMSSDVLGRISELRKRYGDVFALYIGGRLTIFLNGFETINDAFKKQGSLFKRRPVSPLSDDKGIIFTNDETWKEQRGFAQKALHEIGFGVNSRYLDEVINSEITEFIKKISLKDSAIDIKKYLNVGISNVILKLVCSHRYDTDDLEIDNFLTRLRVSANKFFIREAILSCFPFLSRFPKLKLTIIRFFENQTIFIDKCIAKGRENRNSETRNFVQMFYEKVHENLIGGLQNSFDHENISISVYQLLAAGSETTAGSVMWILLHLIRNPHIQDKMAAEMDDILGSDGLTISDRKRLPYTHSVMLEGLRIACVAPLGIPHTVAEDVMFHGFLIPKHCSVLANLSSSLKDPHVWKEPDEFRPDRFLSEDRESVIVPKEFIPFSLGPRSCLGETLARNEVFLYVASIVRKFKLCPENDGFLPESRGVFGVTYHPVPFKMRLIPR
ncbi:cytochrome P450 2U1-like [Mercenaria mercenaria]|uniref:cytochrome P450 2U1-like n=1 Tax=Mercenaria mercenaria TaxID=6596 RepID=UPI00234ED8E2|nr:cytochrome P450 2U1-like [Mercenaria mercenaria]